MFRSIPKSVTHHIDLDESSKIVIWWNGSSVDGDPWNNK